MQHIQILVYCIAGGVSLSLVAAGFNIIFNTTRVFHIAHGLFFVLPVYLALQFNHLLIRAVPDFSWVLSIIFSLIICSLVVWLIEAVLYLPLNRSKANPVISLITSLGVYIVFTNLLIFFFGTDSVSLNTNNSIVYRSHDVQITTVDALQIGVGLALLSIFGLFSRTKGYLYMKAVSDDYSVAERFGLNIAHIRIASLLIGTVLVASAGFIKAYGAAIEPNSGLPVVVMAAVAVIAGGVRSLKGTFLICFLVAVIQNYSVLFLPLQWTECLVYLLLLIVLLIFNRGLISINQRVEQL